MSHDVSEFIPTIANPIQKMVDKLKANTTGIPHTHDQAREIIPGAIDVENIAGEINRRIEWMRTPTSFVEQSFGGKEPKVIVGVPKDNFTFAHEFKTLKRDQRIVNAIRLNGATAFVTQEQRGRVARHMTDRVVGSFNEFSYGKDKNPTKDKARQEQWEQVSLYMGAALGHKASIEKLAKQKEESKKQLAQVE